MNRFTTIILLAIAGFLAGCSDMPMRSSFSSGGAGTDGMTSSGGAGTPGGVSGAGNSWYNGQKDISRQIYFGA
ncbi:hypothetical protein RY831_29145 [Noviherbaspirillum sp. CPCC 100848]|uniref:Peptidoglycan-associated lipoprotein n=1 Tax=Noviherbaspirillum album TaxID=3080276 RepID=A0ABU6JHS8_9BURK|nr:hypothetical protein [Noviherbaspirillum sp. CPCC 100848]MEC4723230.1 hypothetical protein [Noviherbaspirillum sp. CPCC 100848]